MINNKYFNIFLQNPLKTYWKIKKYFKTIKFKISIGASKRNDSKILTIRSYDVSWKDKYNSPSHERNPIIYISIFNCLYMYIEFTLKKDSLVDLVYWEAALYWLHYRKNLHIAVKKASGWTDYNNGKKKKIYFDILKEPWQTLYNKHKLPKIKYENSTR